VTAADRERLLKAARVLPFRRRPFAARRRRRSLGVALLGPLAGALAVVGVPLTLAGWVLWSPRFALRHVEVEEPGVASAAWARQALAPLRGRNLLLLEAAEVERRLAAHPWVDGAEVRKELPDRVLVRLRERRPAALLRRGAELVYLDAAGEAIAPYDPRLGAPDLLLLSAAAARPAELRAGLELALELERLQPQWAAGLSEVEVLGDGDFRLYTAALPFPLLVDGATLQRQLRWLEAVLPQLLARYGQLDGVDLRFARRIVVQPAAKKAA
jgi:cell division protein FtsQ